MVVPSLPRSTHAATTARPTNSMTSCPDSGTTHQWNCSEGKRKSAGGRWVAVAAAQMPTPAPSPRPTHWVRPRGRRTSPARTHHRQRWQERRERVTWSHGRAGLHQPVSAQPGRACLFGHSSARHAAPTRRLQSPDPGPWPTALSAAAPGGRPVAAGAARLRRARTRPWAGARASCHQPPGRPAPAAAGGNR